MKTKRFAIELACCLLAIALLELVLYSKSTDDFSVSVYFTSVVEVFVAPIHPGWSLVYPPVALLGLFAGLAFSARIARSAARVALIFLLVALWTVLGFHTIVAYYQ